MLLIALFAGCAAVAPRPLWDGKLDGPALGIAVKIRTPIWIVNMTPDVVYFVKVDEDKGLLQHDVIVSSHSKGGRFYAMDLKPGTYAAVAAYITFEEPNGEKDGRMTYKKRELMVYFSEELVKRTMTTISEDKVAFMGRFSVYQMPVFMGADPVQKHYARIITPAFLPPGLVRAILGDEYYRGNLIKAENDDGSRDEFFEKMSQDLAHYRRPGLAAPEPVPERMASDAQ